MASRIYADSSTIEKTARQIEGIVSDMEAQANKIREAGEQTTAIWKSDYTPAYLASVEEVKKRVAITTQELRRTAQDLRNIASEVRRAEREIERKNRRKR